MKPLGSSLGPQEAPGALVGLYVFISYLISINAAFYVKWCNFNFQKMSLTRNQLKLNSWWGSKLNNLSARRLIPMEWAGMGCQFPTEELNEMSRSTQKFMFPTPSSMARDVKYPAMFC